MKKTTKIAVWISQDKTGTKTLWVKVLDRNEKIVLPEVVNQDVVARAFRELADRLQGTS